MSRLALIGWACLDLAQTATASWLTAGNMLLAGLVGLLGVAGTAPWGIRLGNQLFDRLTQADSGEGMLPDKTESYPEQQQ